MSDETVASLGFKVESGELDQAKQKLSEVTTEAGKTGKAVDDFNQKVGKTGAEAGKAAEGIGKVDPALRALEATARRSNIPVEQLTANLAKFKAETAALGGSTGTATSAIGSLVESVRQGVASFFGLGSASAAVTKEHEAHNSALSSLRGNLRGMAPLLNQFGGGLGDLVQYSRAARLGLEGFALVTGGAVLVALAKVADEAQRVKNNLVALSGSQELGNRTLNAVKDAAKGGAVELGTMASAVQNAAQGFDKLNDKNVIYANTGDRLTKFTEGLSASFKTLGQAMQSSGADAEEKGKVFAALSDSIKKTGGITAETFQKIRDESLPTARVLAEAFGEEDLDKFQRKLEQTAIPVQQFNEVIRKVAPLIEQNFNANPIKTVGQAIDDIHQQWNRFIDDLAKRGASDLVVGEMKKLQEAAGKVPDAIKAVGDALDGDKQNAKSWSDAWGTAFKVTESDVSIWGSQVEVDITGVLGLVTKAGGEIEKFFETSPNDRVSGAFDAIGKSAGTADKAVEAFSTSASQDMGAVGRSAESMASQTAGSLARVVAQFLSSLQQMKTAAASAIASASAPGSPAEVGTMGSGGGSMLGGGSDGLEGVQLSPSGDAGTIDFGDLSGGSGGFTDNLPAFATGGQFTVGGTGGTDSQTVAFKSTPGEVVTVSTPEQIALQSTGAISGVTTQSDSSAVGVVSATPEPAAVASIKEITDAIDKSSIDITKKVLLGSEQIVTELKKLTGGVAASTVNPATGLPIATMIKSPSGAIVSAAAAAASGGGGFTVKGLNQDWTQQAAALQKSFDQANAAAQGGGGGSYYPGAGQITYARGGSMRGRAGSISGAPTGQFAAVNPNYNTANYNSGYSTDGYGGDPYSGGGYDSGFYGTDYGGSGDIYGSLSDYNSGSSDFYGTDNSGSGSISGSLSDYGSTDILTGGFDPNAMSYGGGSVDAGYFATGGSFTVPGSSGAGIDKTVVTMHATPGETVTVTPLSPNFATAANADPSSQANVTNKTVNIHVQAGIQAESFIRSRAQIARGF